MVGAPVELDALEVEGWRSVMCDVEGAAAGGCSTDAGGSTAVAIVWRCAWAFWGREGGCGADRGGAGCESYVFVACVLLRSWVNGLGARAC